MNFEQLKCKIIFDILPNFQKAMSDTVSKDEMKDTSRIYFKKIYDEVFEGEKLEITNGASP